MSASEIQVSLTVATWNIGGGILGASHQAAGRSEIDYYAAIIAERSPDLVCLQEVHTFVARNDCQAWALAEEAGYEYVAVIPLSVSHLDRHARSSLALLSKFPISDVTHLPFELFDLKTVGPNGKSWELLPKGYMTASVQTPFVVSGEPLWLKVLNGHCYPLHHFGWRDSHPRFASVWRDIGGQLSDLVDSGQPVVVALDLNTPKIESLLGSWLSSGGFQVAFPPQPTTPSGVQQDFLLAAGLRPHGHFVTPTRSDHHYCESTFVL